MSMTIKDGREDVINRILAGIGVGTPGWVKPWDDPQADLHFNAITGHVYRITNPGLLAQAMRDNDWFRQAWVTIPQVLDAGGRIADGEVPLVIGHKRGGWDVVFNIRQCRLMPETAMEPCQEWDDVRAAEQWIADSHVDIDGTADPVVEYVPDHDCIYIPPKVYFPSAGSYYNALLHEIIHWSGHPARLGRDRFVHDPPSEETIRLEEIAAELGAAFLCAGFGIGIQDSSYSYINGWAMQSGSPVALVREAAKIAGQAIDHINESIACRKPDSQPA